jgi:hypothetical protein
MRASGPGDLGLRFGTSASASLERMLGDAGLSRQASHNRGYGLDDDLEWVVVWQPAVLCQLVFCLTCSQTLEITTDPSPTAEATRFTDPARTSPTANMPG